MTKEAMELALEALKKKTQELREMLGEQEQEHKLIIGTGKGVKIPFGFKYKHIESKLPLQPKKEQGEPLTWKNVAIRLGEELSSVGPDGYYDMTPEQWLDWVMAQSPQGKNYLVKQEQGEQLARLGWQEIDCPICGGGARVFPKQEQGEPVVYC